MQHTATESLSFQLLGATLASAFMAAATPMHATAAVVFDNGAYNEGGGGEAQAAAFADDFVLSAAATIRRANLVVRETNPHSWDQTNLTWYMFSDGGTQPGALISSGSALNIQVVNLGPGQFSPRDLLNVSFDLDTPLALGAGTAFWFGLHFGTDFVSPGVQWLSSNTPTGDSVALSADPVASSGWVSGAGDLNFQLLDNGQVPEPSTLFLVLAGVALLRRAQGRPSA